MSQRSLCRSYEIDAGILPLYIFAFVPPQQSVREIRQGANRLPDESGFMIQPKDLRPSQLF